MLLPCNTDMMSLELRTQRHSYPALLSLSQYALYKRMTLAAILIQSRFRSFHEQKKFQQSRRAAVLIQQYYRSYRHSLRCVTHEHTLIRSVITQAFPFFFFTLVFCFVSSADSSLLTKKQNQAARKILRFLLRCRHR